MQNNNEKGYTLRLTEQQYHYFRHLWGSIDREFLKDVEPHSSWWQWGNDMVGVMRQAEIEHNHKSHEQACGIMENVKLLHFTATWCGPCKLMAPMVKEVMRSNPDIEYEKIDIDERPDIVAEFSIQSVPTFVLFKDDMPVAFKSGRMAQKEFEGFLVIHESQEG